MAEKQKRMEIPKPNILYFGPRGLSGGIVTFLECEAGIIPLGNFVDVVNPLTSSLYLVTGNAGDVFLEKDEEEL